MRRCRSPGAPRTPPRARSCWRLPRRPSGSSQSRPAAAVGTSWVVVALSGIGIGLALWALLEILFPGHDRHPRHPRVPDPPRHRLRHVRELGRGRGRVVQQLQDLRGGDQDDEAGGRPGRHLPSLGPTPRTARLKRIIDAACTAQRGTQGTAGCDNGFAVYVPGGVSYDLRPMKETGTHIVTAMGDGGYPAATDAGPVVLPGSQPGRSGRHRRRAIHAGGSTPHFTPNECTGRVPGTVCDEFPFWVTEPGGEPVGRARFPEAGSTVGVEPAGHRDVGVLPQVRGRRRRAVHRAAGEAVGRGRTGRASGSGSVRAGPACA